MPEVIYSLAGKRIYVAGHRGMVGSAIVRRLATEGCEILTATHAELDLRRQDQVEAWMEKNRPDAVFCVNDPVAIQLIMVAKQKKIIVPEELGVVGFSDDPMAEIIEPALTTVQQPVSIIGREAMELLLDTIRLGEKFAPVTHSLKPRLIVRASSVRGQ